MSCSWMDGYVPSPSDSAPPILSISRANVAMSAIRISGEDGMQDRQAAKARSTTDENNVFDFSFVDTPVQTKFEPKSNQWDTESCSDSNSDWNAGICDLNDGGEAATLDSLLEVVLKADLFEEEKFSNQFEHDNVLDSMLASVPYQPLDVKELHPMECEIRNCVDPTHYKSMVKD